MSYKFETRLTSDDSKEMGEGEDYDIFVSDNNDSDNLGSHIPEINNVMMPLGIKAELMENIFTGSFTDEIPNIDALNAYLTNVGWEYLGEFEE